MLIGGAVGFGLAALGWAVQGDCDDPESLCATDGPTNEGDMAGAAALGASIGAAAAWWRRTPRHLAYVPETRFPDSHDRMVPEAPVPPSWTAASTTLLAGEQLEVQEVAKPGERKGTLAQMSQDAIWLLVDGEPYVVRRNSVRRIWTPRYEWWRVALGSAYLGALWGGVVAAIACQGDESDKATDRCLERSLGWTMAAWGGALSVSALAINRQALVYDSAKADPCPPRRTTEFYPVIGRHGAGVAGRSDSDGYSGRGPGAAVRP